MNSARCPIRVLLVLVAVMVFHAVANLLWQGNSNQLSIGASLPHCMALMTAYEDVAAKISSNLGFVDRVWQVIDAATRHQYGYPGLLPAGMSLLLLVFSKSIWIIQTVNLAYIAIILICVYSMSPKVAGPMAGILSMLFVAMYPAIYGASRFYVLELGVTAFVCLSLCFLLYSDNFVNTRFSVLFGLFCGLGMLTKQQFFAFIVGPLGYVLLSVAVKAKEDKDFLKRLLNILAAGGLVFLIAGRYYVGRVGNIYGTLFNEPNAWSLRLFLVDWVGNEITFIFFVFLLWGVAVFLTSREIRKKAFFLLWIVIPAVIFMLSPSGRSGRYIIPFLPSIGIISAFGVSRIRVSRARHSAIAVLILWGIAYNVNFSFGFSFVPTWLGPTPGTNFCEPWRQEGFAWIRDQLFLPEFQRRQRQIRVLSLPFAGLPNQAQGSYIRTTWRIGIWWEDLASRVRIIVPEPLSDRDKDLARLIDEIRIADFLISWFDISKRNAFVRMLAADRDARRFFPTIPLDDEFLRKKYEGNGLALFRQFRFAGKFADIFLFSKNINGEPAPPRMNERNYNSGGSKR